MAQGEEQLSPAMQQSTSALSTAVITQPVSTAGGTTSSSTVIVPAAITAGGTLETYKSSICKTISFDERTSQHVDLFCFICGANSSSQGYFHGVEGVRSHMKRSHRKNGDFKQTFGIESEDLDNNNFVDLVVRPFCMQILSEQTLQEWEAGKAPQNHRRRVEYKLTKDFKATLPAARSIVLPANATNPVANHPAQGLEQLGAARGVPASRAASRSTPDTTASAAASLHAFDADDSHPERLRLGLNGDTRGEQGIVTGKRRTDQITHHNPVLKHGVTSLSLQAALSTHQLNSAGDSAAGKISVSSPGVSLRHDSSQSLRGFTLGHATSNTCPAMDNDSTSDSEGEVAGAMDIIAAAAAEIEGALPSQTAPTEQEVSQHQSARSVEEAPSPESFSYYEGTRAFTPLASQPRVWSTYKAGWMFMESKVGARVYHAHHLESCMVVGQWLFGNSFLIACPHCGQNADEDLTFWENVATVLQHIREAHPYEWTYWKRNIHQCVKRCTSTSLSSEDVFAIENGLNSVRARGPVSKRSGETEKMNIQEHTSSGGDFRPKTLERENASVGHVAKSRALEADSSSDDEPLIKRMRKC